MSYLSRVRRRDTGGSYDRHRSPRYEHQFKGWQSNISLSVMTCVSELNTLAERKITLVTALIVVAISVADDVLVVILALITVGAFVVFAGVYCECPKQIMTLMKSESHICQQWICSSRHKDDKISIGQIKYIDSSLTGAYVIHEEYFYTVTWGRCEGWRALNDAFVNP